MNTKKISIIILSLLLIGIIGTYFFMNKNIPESETINPITPNEPIVNSPEVPSQKVAIDKSNTESNVSWEFTGETWRASGNPPACAEPIQLKQPVDINLATAILYPGQMRSTGYKPHGGFAFQKSQNDDVTVTAALDAYLVKASRYIEQGELQHFLFFVNPCGIAYRFDHLADLSPKIKAVIDKLPEAKVDDSRTTPVNPPILIKAGEVIATSVGFKSNKNVTVDFGVYDLRKTNGISNNQGDKEFASYGLCWLNLFNSDITQKLKSLPAHDQNAGSQSDYCK